MWNSRSLDGSIATRNAFTQRRRDHGHFGAIAGDILCGVAIGVGIGVSAWALALLLVAHILF